MEQNMVLFEEVAAYRLRQITEELKGYEEWPELHSDGVKLLYSIFLALRLSRRAIAVLLDVAGLEHLLAIGVIDQPEFIALKRAGGRRKGDGGKKTQEGGTII